MKALGMFSLHIRLDCYIVIWKPVPWKRGLVLLWLGPRGLTYKQWVEISEWKIKALCKENFPGSFSDFVPRWNELPLEGRSFSSLEVSKWSLDCYLSRIRKKGLLVRLDITR